MELLETFSFTYFVTCRDLPDRPRLDYWTILLHVRRPLSVCWLRFDHHFISTSHHIAPFRSEMWRILRLMTPGQWSVIRRRLEVLQHYDLQSSEGSECNVNIAGQIALLLCNHACPPNQISYPVSMISVTLWSITHKCSTYTTIIRPGTLSPLSSHITVWSLAGSMFRLPPEMSLSVFWLCCSVSAAQSTIGNQL